MIKSICGDAGAVSLYQTRQAVQLPALALNGNLHVTLQSGLGTAAVIVMDKSTDVIDAIAR